MTIPYGREKETFRSSLFVVLCNRLTSCLLACGILLVRSPASHACSPCVQSLTPACRRPEGRACA